MPSFNEVYEHIKAHAKKFGGGLLWNDIVEDVLYAHHICLSKLEKKVTNEELWDILFNINDSEQKLKVVYDHIIYKGFFDKVAWFIVEKPDWDWHGWKNMASLFEK